jgi:hypothetical protein
MRERDIEAHLVRRIKELGGTAYKFVSPGHNGVPDRLICFPGGRVYFAELKAPGKEPTLLQLAEHRRLESLGFKVLVFDSIEHIDIYIKRWAAERNKQ